MYRKMGKRPGSRCGRFVCLDIKEYKALQEPVIKYQIHKKFITVQMEKYSLIDDILEAVWQKVPLASKKKM